MELKIFDVEHGACALLDASGTRIMIDCGHNATNSWRPGTYLSNRGIRYLDYLAITNCDEDHLSGFTDLETKIRIDNIIRNPTLSPEAVKAMKQSGMGIGLTNYLSFLSKSRLTLQPTLRNVSISVFYNKYPYFQDTNNLSLVLFLNINGLKFLFPGDLEKVGWDVLLQQRDFQMAVRATDILIASHHGRESGISESMFDKYGCRPKFVIISDKNKMHDTQETVNYYSSKVRGGIYKGETRKVLTTRYDGPITFNSQEMLQLETV